MGRMMNMAMWRNLFIVGICALLLPHLSGMTVVEDEILPVDETDWSEVVEALIADTELGEGGDTLDWLDRLRMLADDLQAQRVVFDPDIALGILTERLLEWIDPSGGILNPERAERIESQRRGRVFDPGFGLVITDEYLRVGPFRDDVPEATRDALIEGQRILQIDERDMRTTGFYQAHQLLRMDRPDPVILVVQDAENRVVTQRVDRVESILPDVEWLETLPFEMGYLKVNRLRQGTGSRVVEILREGAADGLYGLILDLRSADGEDMESVQVIAGAFADKNAFLYAYRDQDDQDLMVVTAEEAGQLMRMPVMVLINANTRGAAELLAAVLEDSVRGVMLFGQPTPGDLLLRSRVQLSSGPELYLTTRTLVTGGGTVYDGTRGVRPDVITAEADSPFRTARSGRTARIEEEVEQERLYHRIRGDATLRRAVDVLLGLKALDIRPHGTTPHHTR